MKRAKPPIAPEGAEVLTLAQAASLLQLNQDTVSKYAMAGELPGRRIGRDWRFVRADLLRAHRKLQRKQGRISQIYFIQAGTGGPIKIGYALDPRRRLANLQCSNDRPLRIVALLPGGELEERQLHQRFAHLHIRGEWFSDEGGHLSGFARAAAAPAFALRLREV